MLKSLFGAVLAVVAGILPGFFLVFAAVFSDWNGDVLERLVTFLLVAVAYLALGLAWGLAAPGHSWRWGMWLASPAVVILVLYSVREPGAALLSLSYLVLSVACACLAALTGARLRRRTRPA